MFTRIIVFLVCLGAGLGLLVYTKPLKDIVGNIGFAERYIGLGGTYTFLKLLGILAIIFGFIYVTGQMEYLFCTYLGKFVGGCQTAY